LRDAEGFTLEPVSARRRGIAIFKSFRSLLDPAQGQFESKFVLLVDWTLDCLRTRRSSFAIESFK
jgi:hypothetical protein